MTIVCQHTVNDVKQPRADGMSPSTATRSNHLERSCDFSCAIHHAQVWCTAKMENTTIYQQTGGCQPEDVLATAVVAGDLEDTSPTESNHSTTQTGTKQRTHAPHTHKYRHLSFPHSQSLECISQTESTLGKVGVRSNLTSTEVECSRPYSFHHPPETRTNTQRPYKSGSLSNGSAITPESLTLAYLELLRRASHPSESEASTPPCDSEDLGVPVPADESRRHMGANGSPKKSLLMKALWTAATGMGSTTSAPPPGASTPEKADASTDDEADEDEEEEEARIIPACVEEGPVFDEKRGSYLALLSTSLWRTQQALAGSRLVRRCYPGKWVEEPHLLRVWEGRKRGVVESRGPLGDTSREDQDTGAVGRGGEEAWAQSPWREAKGLAGASIPILSRVQAWSRELAGTAWVRGREGRSVRKVLVVLFLLLGLGLWARQGPLPLRAWATVVPKEEGWEGGAGSGARGWSREGKNAPEVVAWTMPSSEEPGVPPGDWDGRTQADDEFGVGGSGEEGEEKKGGGSGESEVLLQGKAGQVDEGGSLVEIESLASRTADERAGAKAAAPSRTDGKVKSEGRGHGHAKDGTRDGGRGEEVCVSEGNPIPALLEFAPALPADTSAPGPHGSAPSSPFPLPVSDPHPTLPDEAKQVVRAVPPSRGQSPRREGVGLSGAAGLGGWGAGRGELTRLYDRGFMAEDLSLMEVVAVFGLEYAHHLLRRHRDDLRAWGQGWCLPGHAWRGGSCKPNAVVRVALCVWDVARAKARQVHDLAFEWGAVAAQQVQLSLPAPPGPAEAEAVALAAGAWMRRWQKAVTASLVCTIKRSSTFLQGWRDGGHQGGGKQMKQGGTGKKMKKRRKRGKEGLETSTTRRKTHVAA